MTDAYNFCLAWCASCGRTSEWAYAAWGVWKWLHFHRLHGVCR